MAKQTKIPSDVIELDLLAGTASPALYCVECGDRYPAQEARQCNRCKRIMCPACADDLMRTIKDEGLNFEELVCENC